VRVVYLGTYERRYPSRSALSRLTTDEALARRIAARGLETYRRRASEDVLGARWRELLEARR
jgi:hypothetical protein